MHNNLFTIKHYTYVAFIFRNAISLLYIQYILIYVIHRIVLFHNYFSPSGEQPEQRKVAYKENNQLPGV